MDRNHFQNEINRLVDTYGTNQYKPERVKIIWREVELLSNAWMTRTVDFFVGNHRHAPIVPEFREEAAKERERLHELKKKEHTKDAKEYMSMYSALDIQTISGQIRDRIKGNMSDDEFDAFKKVLTPDERFQCSRCKDTKVFTDDEGRLYLCDHRRGGY